MKAWLTRAPLWITVSRLCANSRYTSGFSPKLGFDRSPVIALRDVGGLIYLALPTFLLLELSPCRY